MSFKMDRIHVWATEVKDVPGGVTAKLSMLDKAGANLDYVYTQRLPDKPGQGLLCVAPIVGAELVKAAKAAGMHEVNDPVVMRVEGDNTAGLAHRLKHEWALANINLHGAILATLGTKFIGYVTFDTVEDANRAAKILADLGVERLLASAKGH
ncbi:MAG: amino acid-binding ACT [Planctomycetes bacterium]|nr:amino acid-binding ACT [Planctomycetota bacterium]